jgi:DNA-binding MarR family transcriptional regulator
MPVKFGFSDPYLRAWLLLHQAYNLILRSENKVFGEYDISAEQHAVLMAIKYIKSPVTPSEVARWLDRNPNSVSLIVDRMTKGGLVRGIRDLSDRRSVRLVMTKKGKDIYERSTVAGWQLILDILSKMTEEEINTLVRQLEEVRDTTHQYLNPGEELEEVNINDVQNMKRFRRRAAAYTSDMTAQESSALNKAD